MTLNVNDRQAQSSEPEDIFVELFAQVFGVVKVQLLAHDLPSEDMRSGEHQGTWDWLDFGEPPWGNAQSRYFGAAAAAIAGGTAPGYYTPGTNADTDARVELVRGYLKDRFPRENLHNQAWSLWSATTLEGILSTAERRKLIDRLLAEQRSDGGWNLPSLGAWMRSDGTPQETASDGYATGLMLHVLQLAGEAKSDVRIARGLDWLKANQAPTGA